MHPSKSFLHFAAACCLLSMITTLGIHLAFPEPPADFEQRILLFRDQIYLLQRWWIIVHCLLVIVSMCGVALWLIRKSPGFAPLGFLFFAVFGIAEIFRQMIVLFYFNGLREQYHLATDAATKEVFRNTLSTAGLMASPLFGLFMLSFGLGNLFYGIGLAREKGWSRWLSVLLIAWALFVFLSLGNEFWRSESLGSIVEAYSFTYQPLMRLLIAIWLWQKAGNLQNNYTGAILLKPQIH